jgi:hypothetical protein
MKIFKDLEQGSDAWIAVRKGRPTASRFSEIITATGKASASSEPYILELIADCFVPEFQLWAGNKLTDRGTELEPEARDAFAKHTGLTLEQVGFVLSDDGVSGASPDSLIVKDGKYVAGLEMKNPAPKTHVSYVLNGVLPSEYKQQCHGGMVICNLPEWHFWSYFPGMRPLHVVVKWDEYTDMLAKELIRFVDRYKEAMAVAIPRLKPEPEAVTP